MYLLHLLPSCKYPHIVTSPQPALFKDYPYQRTQKVTGFYQMENDFLPEMGFRLFELENGRRLAHGQQTEPLPV